MDSHFTVENYHFSRMKFMHNIQHFFQTLKMCKFLKHLKSHFFPCLIKHYLHQTKSAKKAWFSVVLSLLTMHKNNFRVTWQNTHMDYGFQKVLIFVVGSECRTERVHSSKECSNLSNIPSEDAKILALPLCISSFFVLLCCQNLRLIRSSSSAMVYIVRI